MLPGAPNEFLRAAAELVSRSVLSSLSTRNLARDSDARLRWNKVQERECCFEEYARDFGKELARKFAGSWLLVTWVKNDWGMLVCGLILREVNSDFLV